jgi:hypothetical protein
VARTRVGDGAVANAPLVVGDVVYAQTAKGDLSAFRARVAETG